MSKLANNLDHLNLVKRVVEVVKTFGFMRFAESFDDLRYVQFIKVNYRLRHESKRVQVPTTMF